MIRSKEEVNQRTPSLIKSRRLVWSIQIMGGSTWTDSYTLQAALWNSYHRYVPLLVLVLKPLTCPPRASSFPFALLSYLLALRGSCVLTKLLLLVGVSQKVRRCHSEGHGLALPISFENVACLVVSEPLQVGVLPNMNTVAFSTSSGYLINDNTRPAFPRMSQEVLLTYFRFISNEFNLQTTASGDSSRNPVAVPLYCVKGW